LFARPTSDHWRRRRGLRGCKRTPKSFDLVKILAKSMKIRAKSWESGQNLGKPSQNPWKYLGKNGTQRGLRKMAPNVVWEKWHPTWFEKNGAQRLQNHMKTFFFLGCDPKRTFAWENVLKNSGPKICLGKFGEIRPKILCTPKICLPLHLRIRPYLSLFISRNHLLRQCLILDFLLLTATENVFFACLFLESIKC